MTYEVHVGNIGTVHSGHNAREALRVFRHYLEQSRADSGRSAGESVTVFRDAEIWREYIGPQDREAR